VALGATLYHLEIAWSDSDRGVYESIDLRAARHPSETMRYLVARTVALCLLWEPDIAFSKGLSTADEPAVWVREREGNGRIRLWVDLGTPSADRLHKASKASARVAVVTYDDVEGVRRAVGKERVHRASDIEVIALPTAFLDAVAEATGRHTRWELLQTGSHLYATVGGKSFDGPVVREALAVEA